MTGMSQPWGVEKGALQGKLPGATKTDVEETVINGQHFTIIPDPSAKIKAKILLAIDDGLNKIMTDQEIPELLTRGLINRSDASDNRDPLFILKREIGHFIKGVQQLLEAACSLRAMNPNIDLVDSLRNNIWGFENQQVNNLEISVSGVLLAETLLDWECPGWRSSRDSPLWPRVDRARLDEYLIRPRVGRESEAAKASKYIVKKMIKHLLQSADAQELIGEPGSLQIERTHVCVPPKPQINLLGSGSS
jgi:hypothetical protein